jgi:hypothetical protein
VSFDIEEELDTVEPVFERGLEGMRVEAAAASPRRKTAKRKGPKRVAKKADRKKTASKRSARRVAKKRAVKKAVRKGRARKGARKRAAKRR